MSIIQGLQSHYRLLGSYGVFLVVLARLQRKPFEITVKSDGVTHPVHLRLRTTDVSVFEEILLNGEYNLDLPRPPQVIVDAGANIGMSSIYFANRYPAAKIVAIEPEHCNFVHLCKNIEPYKNIIPVEAALWKENTQLNLSDPGTGSWGFQTTEHCSAADTGLLVNGLTVDTLMQTYGLAYIDVLKIDIEGSEKEVFETCAPWIDRVGMLIIELHDRSKSGCSRSVYRATQDFAVEWRKGETTFFAREGYVPAKLPYPLAPMERDGVLSQGRRRGTSLRIIAAAS